MKTRIFLNSSAYGGIAKKFYLLQNDELIMYTREYQGVIHIYIVHISMNVKFHYVTSYLV